MINREKIRKKLDFLRQKIRMLKSLGALPEEEFLKNDINCHAAERALQISIEAILDIANHIIAQEGLGIPGSYQEAIDILIRNGFLPREKRDNYRNMVKFRNRLVHLYDAISEKEIYRIITGNLSDLEEFAKIMVERFFK